MPNGKPNILVLWGDDIGYWNISANNKGMMGYSTPNIDRIAREGIGFTDFYGQQSCTAGRSAFITGQNPLRTGLTKVGFPGAKEGLQRRGPDDRRAAQAARLRDRAVRQEPSGRPRRASAHQPRLRRVLRQPLPPQRRGGAGARGLPEGPGVPQALRPARRHPQLGDARRHPEDRGHRPAHQEAHGDHRRRGDRADARVPRGGGRRRQAVLPVVERDPHALPHAHQGREPRAERAGRLQRRHGRARQPRGHDPRQARRARNRRGHHRDVLDRQRPALQHLARRRHHALRLREEQQLGGRLPRSVLRALARQVAGGRDAQRHRRPPGHAAHVPRGRRRPRHRRGVPSGSRGRRQDLQGRARRQGHERLLRGRRRTRARAPSSSTSTTTPSWWRFVSATGSTSSRSSAPRRWPCGPSPSSTCAFRASSISGAIRSSGRSRTRTPTGTG